MVNAAAIIKLIQQNGIVAATACYSKGDKKLATDLCQILFLGKEISLVKNCPPGCFAGSRLR